MVPRLDVAGEATIARDLIADESWLGPQCLLQER